MYTLSFWTITCLFKAACFMIVLECRYSLHQRKWIIYLINCLMENLDLTGSKANLVSNSSLELQHQVVVKSFTFPPKLPPLIFKYKFFFYDVCFILISNTFIWFGHNCNSCVASIYQDRISYCSMQTFEKVEVFKLGLNAKEYWWTMHERKDYWWTSMLA